MTFCLIWKSNLIIFGGFLFMVGGGVGCGKLEEREDFTVIEN